jgi:3-hydroxyisobutyrate dehydrogenase-like beta-hydroxyacid dehydrogenase
MTRAAFIGLGRMGSGIIEHLRRQAPRESRDGR